MSQEAAVEPCERCGGHGWYMYDHNHGKPCEACCGHTSGTWEAGELQGLPEGSQVCSSGCGTYWKSEDDYLNR